MDKPFTVVVFSEGAFDRIKGFDSEPEAEAFALGVVTGADLYGAGSIGVYVLPAEISELERTEKSDAVAEFRRFYSGDPMMELVAG